MALPDFLIIGAQKSGTTWLAKKLGQHPEIYIAPQEIHFFDKDFNFKKGIEWYKSRFEEVKNGKVIGEKTPDYYWTDGNGVEGHLPNVHRNIYNALPDVKLVLVLRNPVERAISAANHIRRSGRISPFHSIDELLLGNKRYMLNQHGVIDKSLYYKHIQSFLKYFKREQLLILIFEVDIAKNPSLGLKKVCNFFGVDDTFEFKGLEERDNAFKHSRLRLICNYYLPILSPAVKRIDRFLPEEKIRPNEKTITELYGIFEEENAKLFDFLGYEITSWRLK